MTSFQHTFTRAALAVAAVASVVSCGGSSEPRVENPKSFQQQFSAEMNEERQQFIRDSERRLDELDNKVGQLQARVDHESQYVQPSESAEWKQQLFEQRQQQQKVRQELERARNATPEEWQAMRGGLDRAVDRVEAAFSTMGANITGIFESDDKDKDKERQPVRGQDEGDQDVPDHPHEQHQD
jgi:Skp family chaperone for outer membrane proteins